MAVQINPRSIASQDAPGIDGALAELCKPGDGHVLAAVQAALDTARRSATGTFLRTFDTAALAQARESEARRKAGAPARLLEGIAISAKDLFDVRTQPATGGSVVLHGDKSATTGLAAPLTEDAAAVARLRAAGACLIGHTGMTEFAFSGVGVNPHHGTPPNPVAALLDSTPRIPGGSTSGGAASVAIGAAWAALGSDTGGSIRIPAALMGLVGFKNSQFLTPLAGAIPLSSTLDTACAITTCVRDAMRLHAVLSNSTWPGSPPPQHLSRPARLAVPRQVMLDDLEPAVAAAFERALACARSAGMQVIEIDLPELSELAALQAQGGFSAAESWAWHRPLLEAQGSAYDPRVAVRIRRGATMLAADYIQLHQQRRDWIQRVQQRLSEFDAALSPTVPMTAPPLAPLQVDDSLFFLTNAALLRNPSVVNMFDGCALSLPCQLPGELPVGLMVWGPNGHDDTVLQLGLQLEAALSRHKAS
ncbi:MAG: amidase [Burkholderiales bacterium PBB6]|nr:MAG: amidase [Burkholderiales bacterium PBB6]